jgi:hypothetical protein
MIGSVEKMLVIA